MKRFVHELAIEAEKFWDRLFPRRRARPEIDPYRGYATPTELVVRGRVLARPPRHRARVGTSRFANFRDIARLFATREIPDIRIESGGHETRSDEEGYFTLRLPRPIDVESGWHAVTLRIPDVARSKVYASVRVAPPQARRLTISDIDDTVMETGAFAIARNLWTSLTGSALTRHVYPDAVELLNALTRDGEDPVFYVSSSPWNLHHFLTMVFERTRVPMGPMFLRDLGISETQFIKGTHGDHKGQSIDTILRAVPDVPVTLMGDTGQHDAVVYADAVDRWPQRIDTVILHRPNDALSQESVAGLERLRAQGVTLLVEADYARALGAIRVSV